MKQNKNVKKILIILVLIGLAIRVLFALDFEINRYQYDIGTQEGFNAKNREDYQALMDFDRKYLMEGGHLEYILTIYKTGHLPEINTNQMYHPPLSHAIYAGFMKIESLFTNDSKFLIESLEFVSILYSMIIVFVGYKIMKEIGFEDKDTILPIAFLLFHPLFIYLSRLVNTDGLVSIFILISILYLIKWYKNPSYKKVIVLALSIGLGAMTKTSIIVMAMPLIFVYMKKMIEEAQEEKPLKSLVLQGIIFSFLCIPLTFAYPIRNSIKFDQPMFGIVEALDNLAIADNSFAGRWILNHEIFNNALMPNASNVWANLIISTTDFAINSDVIPVIVTYPIRFISLILIAFSLYAMIRYTPKSENRSSLLILIVTYLSWIFGYINFNRMMPYSCTIHARYIITAIVIGIIYIGILYKNLQNKAMKIFLLTLSIIFMLLSVLMFSYLIIAKFIVVGV